MTYNGYNGSIEIDNDHVVITHTGLVAKTGGLVRDRPRRIPLAAISGVGFKDATKLLNGWLTIGLRGEAPPTLSAGTAPSDANTLIFRNKNRAEFNALRDWLLGVVEHYKSQGVDPSTVEFEAPTSSRLEKIQTKSERFSEKVVQTKEEKIAGKIGDERTDIVQAAARMGWRLGGNRELKKLAEHLHDGETVRFIAQGTYETKQGILVLTDARLLFLFHGIIGQAKEDFPLRLISSVQTKSGFATGELRVFVSGNSSAISGIVKTDLNPLADAIRQGMAQQSSPAAVSAAAPAAQASDPFEDLQKLAALRDAGVISETEFSSKKEEILGRM